MEEKINNKSPYYIMNECPLCMDSLDISNQSILTTDCCSKDIHLSCISRWTKNINNKNKQLCPLCRQTSELIIDIGAPQNSTTIDISLNNEPYNNIINRIIDSSNPSESSFISIDSTHLNINVRRNLRNTKNIICFNICCFSLIIGLIFYVVLFNCKNENHCD